MFSNFLGSVTDFKGTFIWRYLLLNTDVKIVEVGCSRVDSRSEPSGIVRASCMLEASWCTGPVVFTPAMVFHYIHT